MAEPKPAKPLLLQTRTLERQAPLGLAPGPERYEMTLQERRARDLLDTKGWEPLTDWPGSTKETWPRRCLACGFVVRRPSTTLEVGACAHPTPEQEQATLELLVDTGWEPIEPWSGELGQKRQVRCLTCGFETRRAIKPKTLRPCDRHAQTGPGTPVPPSAEWILPAPVDPETVSPSLAAYNLRQMAEARVELRWGQAFTTTQLDPTWVQLWAVTTSEAVAHTGRRRLDPQVRHEILSELAEALRRPSEVRWPRMYVEEHLDDELLAALLVRHLSPAEQDADNG
ncbi:hypothetical protein [Kitasatospora sp. NPDC056731]|uniref:hypothetical protein n=1 Tax=Kitasatospora sp. NPDC056731 TaxID=3155422 RepID=UPI003447F2C3